MKNGTGRWHGSDLQRGHLTSSSAAQRATARPIPTASVRLTRALLQVRKLWATEEAGFGGKPGAGMISGPG